MTGPRTFVITSGDIRRCPLRSFMAEHYNDDGTCRCPHERGWWNMYCWNGLSAAQQRRLIEHGNLPLGYRPQGWCKRGGTVAIEREIDEADGPRFYCVPCAVEYLQQPINPGDNP